MAAGRNALLVLVDANGKTVGAADGVPVGAGTGGGIASTDCMEEK